MAPTNLAAKLKIKPNHRVLVLGADAERLGDLPSGAHASSSGKGPFDVVVAFIDNQKALKKLADKAIAATRDGGVLWLAYPKTTSGVVTDMTRDKGWEPVKSAGWGPVALASLDDVWAALWFKPEGAVKRKAGSVLAPAAASKKSAPKRPTKPPADLLAAIAKSTKANATWGVLAPSHVREYVDWIESAKLAETRARRLTQAIEMLEKGVRDRNAKYR